MTVTPLPRPGDRPNWGGQLNAAIEARPTLATVKATVGTETDRVVRPLVADYIASDPAIIDAATAAAAPAVEAAAAGLDIPPASGQGFEPARAPITTTPAVGAVVPIDSHGGWLYGYQGQVLYRTLNWGGAWEVVRDFATVTGGTVGGDFQMLLPLAGGEVLAVRNFALWRSSGFATDPATATWTLALQAPSSAWFTTFNVDTDPASGRVAATCYTSGGAMNDSDKVWLSTDNAQTFTQVFSLNTTYPALASTGHMHLAAIDPWANGRLWISYHDTTTNNTRQEVAWSDDNGVTWTVLPTGMDTQPTVGIATEWGMVFGSDDNHNGLYRVVRTPDPADMRWEIALTIHREPVMGWATRAVRDSHGHVHVSFMTQTPGGATYVASTDGYRADVTHTIPALTATDTPNIRRFTEHDGRLIAVVGHEAGATRIVTTTTPRRGTTPVHLLNSGGALGGRVFDGMGVAVGEDARTTETQAVAVGRRTTAGQLSTALGYGADASAAYATAIGHQALAGANGVAFGRLAKAVASGIAIGLEANGPGSNATVIGYKAATGAGANATAIGSQASATGTDATAIGAGATSVGQGTAIGRAATASDNATAIGRGANAAHARSIALGHSTATTRIDQVAVGGRHIELGHVASGVTPPADTLMRLYVHRHGDGRHELRVQGPTGQIGTIFVETL